MKPSAGRGSFLNPRATDFFNPGVAMTDSKIQQGAEIIKPKLVDVLGPGLITGASDDDPSGIATYAQVGAQFGYGMAWIMIFSYPLMAAIQEISARMGRVTGKGIAGNLLAHYPRWILNSAVSLLFIANTINIGADLGAMGDALKLLAGGSVLIYVLLFGLATILLEVYVDYKSYVSVLKWLTLSLFAYVATAFFVKISWLDLASNVVIPPITFSRDYIVAMVAVLGTTISPYLFFWQAEQEVEDEKENPGKSALADAPSQAEPEFTRIRLDTYVGMAFSNIVAFFIIVTTAATLNVNHITDIQTSAQAAEALRPLAGDFAFFLFAAGIIGTGLLALPVLAGSSAYAIGEAAGWNVGLARKSYQAKGFYLTIAVSILIGTGMNFLSIDPIKALFWSAVINGVVAVPIMFLMMRMAMNQLVMQKYILPRYLQIAGWVSTFVMAMAVVTMLVTIIG